MQGLRLILTLHSLLELLQLLKTHVFERHWQRGRDEIKLYSSNFQLPGSSGGVTPNRRRVMGKFAIVFSKVKFAAKSLGLARR